MFFVKRKYVVPYVAHIKNERLRSAFATARLLRLRLRLRLLLLLLLVLGSLIGFLLLLLGSLHQLKNQAGLGSTQDSAQRQSHHGTISISVMSGIVATR